MPATVSFTAGTITTILTPTTGQKTAGNVPNLLTINPSDFTGGSAQGMASIPEEILQFVNACDVGDSGVSGWGLGFWPTVIFIRKCLQALEAKGAPSSYNPV